MDAPSLDNLRQEIDVIDRDLHGLIRRRAELVDKIAASKPNGGLTIRPGREAQVLRQRLATHQGAFPAAAVYRMWREMMSSFALMQTPGLRIAVCRPVDQPGYWDLARDHFGC
ncbi:MAG TPA: chorismate mutase, partial [Reyranella sp.]|nr:chorismate mutase [Reyranella sp.]